MTLFYFTATGNSLFVAKSLVQKFEGAKLCSIPQHLQGGVYEDDVIGIITPTHNFAIPFIIEEFLKKSRFKCSYFFTIFTCGGFVLGALDFYKRLMDKLGIRLDYLNNIEMVDNYLRFSTISKQKQLLPKKKADEKLEAILQDIASQKRECKKSNFFYHLGSLALYHFLKRQAHHKQFHIQESCINCQVCIKVCPVGNLIASEKTPIYQNHCIGCLACTHHCPTHSIRLKGEKSEERYRHEKISLQEIIRSNHIRGVDF